MKHSPDLITAEISSAASGSHPGMRSHSLTLFGFISVCQSECKAHGHASFPATYQEWLFGQLHTLHNHNHSEACPIHGHVCVFSFSADSLKFMWKRWCLVVTGITALPLSVFIHSFIQTCLGKSGGLMFFTGFLESLFINVWGTPGKDLVLWEDVVELDKR